MVSSDWQQSWSAWKQRVEGIQGSLNADPVDRQGLQGAIADLQTKFQQELTSLSPDLAPDIAQSVRAVQIEVDKQLRLLNTDILFLQAARQSETLAQRLQQMGDRLERLTRYCDLLLER